MTRREVPRDAPAYASSEALVAAPVDVVWGVLTGLEDWPKWNVSVSRMDCRGPVVVGTEFHWLAGGVAIHSRIEELDAPRRVVWTGRTMGIRAVHAWELTPAGGGTNVRTEEAFEGLIVRLFAGRMRRELDRALAQGLDALKREAERRRSMA